MTRIRQLGALLLALGVSAVGRPQADGLEESRTMDLEVVARVGAGPEASWWASAGAERLDAAPPAGSCRPVEAAPAEPRPPSLDGLRLGGPLDGALVPAEGGRWETVGPRVLLDPAWAVGSVSWRKGEVETVGADALRFGAVPVLTRADRGPRGDVELGWEADTADQVRIRVQGPAGLVECGVDGARAHLPWWAVPAKGGEVALRSERVVELPLDAEHRLRIRAVIERMVPLDQAPESASRPITEPAAPILPRDPPRARRGPRPVRS